MQIFKIGAKLQKIFELSAHFIQKNAKNLTFLSRFCIFCAKYLLNPHPPRREGIYYNRSRGKIVYVHFRAIVLPAIYYPRCTLAPRIFILHFDDFLVIRSASSIFLDNILYSFVRCVGIAFRHPTFVHFQKLHSDLVRVQTKRDGPMTISRFL